MNCLTVLRVTFVLKNVSIDVSANAVLVTQLCSQVTPTLSFTDPITDKAATKWLSGLASYVSNLSRLFSMNSPNIVKSSTQTVVATMTSIMSTIISHILILDTGYLISLAA